MERQQESELRTGFSSLMQPELAPCHMVSPALGGRQVRGFPQQVPLVTQRWSQAPRKCMAMHHKLPKTLMCNPMSHRGSSYTQLRIIWFPSTSLLKLSVTSLPDPFKIRSKFLPLASSPNSKDMLYFPKTYFRAKTLFQSHVFYTLIYF